ncbi:hypothetical protein CRYUN_Cryun40dG0079600 [Craigia yunnanensis]
MIILWMAQGFIQPLSGNEDPENVGHEYFMDLLWRSFFQVAAKDGSGNVVSFTMHDLMHELACSVAGTECCIANLKAEKINERTRHVSFEDELDSCWKIPSTMLKAKRLRTFIQDGRLDQSACDALLSNFKNLRVLILCAEGIESLPHSIGKPGKQVGQLRELNGLNNLEGEIRISSLQNAIPESGSTYMKEKLNLKSLGLSWDEVDDDEDDHVINAKYEMVFECLQPHPNLE